MFSCTSRYSGGNPVHMGLQQHRRQSPARLAVPRLHRDHRLLHTGTAHAHAVYPIMGRRHRNRRGRRPDTSVETHRARALGVLITRTSQEAMICLRSKGPPHCLGGGTYRVHHRHRGTDQGRVSERQFYREGKFECWMRSERITDVLCIGSRAPLVHPSCSATPQRYRGRRLRPGGPRLALARLPGRGHRI